MRHAFYGLFKTNLLIFTFIFICWISLPAQAVDSSPKPLHFWFYANAGPAYYGGSAGIRGSLGAEYVHDHSLYSIEYFAMDKIKVYQPLNTSTENTGFVQGIGLLYGRLYGRGIFKFFYASGLAVIANHVRETEGDVVMERMAFTVGLPVSVQLLVTPVKLVAAGIRIFANANLYNSFVGAGLAIYWGKVR